MEIFHFDTLEGTHKMVDALVLLRFAAVSGMHLSGTSGGRQQNEASMHETRMEMVQLCDALGFKHLIFSDQI